MASSLMYFYCVQWLGVVIALSGAKNGWYSTIYAVLPLPERAMLFRYSNRVWAVCHDRGAGVGSTTYTHTAAKGTKEGRDMKSAKGKKGKTVLKFCKFSCNLEISW